MGSAANRVGDEHARTPLTQGGAPTETRGATSWGQAAERLPLASATSR